MAIIWHDETLTPERMLKLLEDQQQQWLDTAVAFDRLKTYLSGSFSLQDAEGNANACRARAESLNHAIQSLREQCKVPDINDQQVRSKYIQ